MNDLRLQISENLAKLGKQHADFFFRRSALATFLCGCAGEYGIEIVITKGKSDFIWWSRDVFRVRRERNQIDIMGEKTL